MMKKVLNAWDDFLMSEESADQVLHANNQGWFNDTGKNDLETVANKAADQNNKFEEHFICDPSAPCHGYQSWDAFFTRQFRDGQRPLAGSKDDNIIANACESKPYNTAYNCSLRDKFWNKKQPYSIQDMCAHDALATQFDGGTVYQAFLSALSYHRWHAPVSGTIKKAFVVGAIYDSEPLWEGLGDPEKRNNDIDEDGETTCQGYLARMAARAVIFIEAVNSEIGLMAFIGIGMDEVSTCDITVKEGQHIEKGQEIGM